MHVRRLAAFLLGAWLGGSVFMDMVATANFRSVDRLLAAPPAPVADRIQALSGHDAARVFLRYQASEQNRWYFETWERVQMVLGAVLFLALVFGGPPNRLTLLVTLLMLAIVLMMHFFLTPEITRLGRSVDFAPTADRSRFWTFHGIYSASELIKLGLGIVLGVRLVLRTKKARPAETEAVHEDGQTAR
jgi:hypothetical protein